MIRQLVEAARKFKQQIPYLPWAVRLVFRAAGGLTLIWFILLIVQGLLPAASVYLTKYLVDGIARIVGSGSGWEGLMPLVPAAAAMALVLILGEIFQGILGLVSTAQSEQVQDHVQGLIHAQAMRLDLSFFDDPGYYDRLHRARIDALHQPVALIQNSGSLLQSFITLTVMTGVLLSFGIWIPLLLVLGTIPALVVVVHNTLRYHRLRMRNTMAERQTDYYDTLLTQRDAAAEMRLFGLGPHFRDRFAKLRERLRREEIELARDEALSHASASLIGLAAMGGALVWMGLRVSRGTLSLGDLALFIQAFLQGQRMMRSLLGSAGEIYRNVMFLENLFEFLALRPKVDGPEHPVAHPGLKSALELDNITFFYPGTTRPALDSFSLTIPAGRITALVGENGAGKSTLIKLLCRFYDPDEGRVLIDGTDIRRLDPDELRRRITVLFQEPVRYHDTVFNNIAFGDIDGRPDPARIETAARAAGADVPILRLPGTYSAVLGRWFGGAELSGGEWRRLALARAFLRQAELIILDEPTSAMDSWAEADWLARFRRLVAGRTALIITHRFTTAMQADVIHVMERGRIIESGSHPELLELNGRYAVSWKRQMSGGRHG